MMCVCVCMYVCVSVGIRVHECVRECADVDVCACLNVPKKLGELTCYIPNRKTRAPSAGAAEQTNMPRGGIV